MTDAGGSTALEGNPTLERQGLSPSPPDTSTATTDVEEAETCFNSVELESTSSRVYPGPPDNSPEGTVHDDAGGVDANTISEKLVRSFSFFSSMGATNGASDAEETQPSKVDDSTDSGDEDEKVDENYHPEQSNWEQIAMEDVSKALMRLAMLAKDEHKVDRSRSVSEIYSAHLAALILDADVPFDPNFLFDDDDDDDDDAEEFEDLDFGDDDLGTGTGTGTVEKHAEADENKVAAHVAAISK